MEGALFAVVYFPLDNQNVMYSYIFFFKIYFMAGYHHFVWPIYRHEN